MKQKEVKMKGLEKTAMVLSALGAILLGLMTFNYDLIGSLVGANIVATIIYALVGLSGIWALVKVFK
ncbi:DUF378 domain-containing protein [Candidatus Pacearchaeota archaeon]|jgi:uncharacterized membrane protein YuzA (DUF378 family)|nr:DUF378 domain-containing protein [Candidatus Pacearchaeota archaeon]|tara:strand:- start:642 stop:842 length:201 start_codon:yes stop_codon:yes gene_type:complete